MNCWQCQAPYGQAEWQCGQCGALLPPNRARTHFDVLGQPPSFRIDLDELARSLRTLQRRFHPDRHAHRSDTERRFSLEHATALNDAHRVLSDPLRRAEYMIQLGGVDLSDEARQVKLPPFFLMEMMELREALDELTGADNHVERGRIERDIAARYEASLEAIAVGLEDTETPLVDVAQSAAKLKYLKRILDDINELSHSTADEGRGHI